MQWCLETKFSEKWVLSLGHYPILEKAFGAAQILSTADSARQTICASWIFVALIKLLINKFWIE